MKPTLLLVLGEVLLGSSEDTLVEAVVLEVVINLVSDDLVNTRELLLEESDDLINGDNIVGKSVALVHEPSPVRVAVGLNLFDLGPAVGARLLALTLITEGKDKIVLELTEVLGGPLLLFLEGEDLLLGLLDVSDGVVTSSDLGVLEVPHGFVQMLLEDVKLAEDSVNKGLGLSLVSSTVELLKLEGFVVINMVITN